MDSEKNKKGSVEFYGGSVSVDRFIGIIEKRVRKFIRVNGLFSPEDRICVLDDGSAAFLLSRFILEKLSLKIPIRLETRKKITKKMLERFDKIVFPLTADDQIDRFLETLFFDDVQDFFGTEALSVALPVTERECFLFAKHNKRIDSKGLKQKEHMLDEFEKPYPETKFAMQKSIREIRKIIKL